MKPEYKELLRVVLRYIIGALVVWGTSQGIVTDSLGAAVTQNIPIIVAAILTILTERSWLKSKK